MENANSAKDESEENGVVADGPPTKKKSIMTLWTSSTLVILFSIACI